MPPRSAVSIRVVRSQEAATVEKIITEMLTDSPLAFGERLTEARARTEHDWNELVQHLITPNTRTAFLAADKLGACGFVCADAALPEAPPAMVVISRLWVAPRQRGSGLGRRLMTAVTEWAQQKNAARIGLGVTEMNTNAMQFYEHLGYRDIGVRFPWPPDPSKQIIVLGRELRA